MSAKRWVYTWEFKQEADGPDYVFGARRDSVFVGMSYHQRN